MVLQTRRKQDHGQFRFSLGDGREEKIIHDLIGRAGVNPARPGHGWCRVGVAQDGEDLAVYEFHVDLHTKIVEVREMCDGVETARRTYDLIEAAN